MGWSYFFGVYGTGFVAGLVVGVIACWLAIGEDGRVGTTAKLLAWAASKFAGHESAPAAAPRREGPSFGQLDRANSASEKAEKLTARAMESGSAKDHGKAAEAHRAAGEAWKAAGRGSRVHDEQAAKHDRAAKGGAFDDAHPRDDAGKFAAK